ncbi:MAG: tRNA uridine-5-carboxymethylaminomethyl(34) synthesis GTPase MnmE, partial [Planctomycetota bacterium]
MYPLDDTIAAIATAPRGGLRGIIRLSGPESLSVVGHHFESAEPQDAWRANQKAGVTAGSLRLDEHRQVPCELYCWPTAQSYTRQPTVELHTTGALPLLEQLLEILCHSGARLAGPGEFTLRAFLAGRLDLTQAEAV